MSLKSLIQRLLDSRTTPEEAAHSAMPKPETPTIVSDPVTDKTWHSLIAPFDGYFSCKGITKHMLIENSAAQWSGVTGLTSGGYMGFTLPMSKGSEVRYQLDHNSTGVMMTFSKTIGGGYNILLWRALSCLRALSLFSPRSSFRTNPNGSAAKHIHQRGFSSQTARQNTFLQGMVTWVSTSLTRAQITALIFTRSGRMEKSSQEKLLDSQLARAISLFQVLYPLRKVIESWSTVPSQSYGSRQQWGANSNLSTGGALC